MRLAPGLPPISEGSGRTENGYIAGLPALIKNNAKVHS